MKSMTTSSYAAITLAIGLIHYSAFETGTKSLEGAMHDAYIAASVVFTFWIGHLIEAGVEWAEFRFGIERRKR